MTWLRFLKPRFCNNFSFLERNLSFNSRDKCINFLFFKYQCAKPPQFRHYCSNQIHDPSSYAVVLNKRDSVALTISEVRSDGFVLSTGSVLVGSTIIFPHSLISWHVANASYVTEESLTIFKILDPKVDILVFGYGNPHDYGPEIQAKFTQFCKKFKIKYEALPTQQAVGLYNFLALEMRFVGAALIPPNTLKPIPVERRRGLSIEDLEDEEEEEEEKSRNLEMLTPGTIRKKLN